MADPNYLDMAIELLLGGNQQLNQSIVNAADTQLQGAQQQVALQQRREDINRQDRQMEQQRQYDLEDTATQILQNNIASLQQNLAYLSPDDPLRGDILAATDYLNAARSAKGDRMLDLALTGSFSTRDGKSLNVNNLIGLGNRKALEYQYNMDRENVSLQASQSQWQNLFDNFVNYSSEEAARKMLQNFAESPSTDPLYQQKAKDILSSGVPLTGDYAKRIKSSEVATLEAQQGITEQQLIITTSQGNVAVNTEEARIAYENLAPEERQAIIDNYNEDVRNKRISGNISEIDYYILDQTKDVVVEKEGVGLMSMKLANDGQVINNETARINNAATELEYTENLMTSEGRIALINKQNVNGLTISDQEVEMGALQIKLGNADLNIKLQAYDIGELQKRRIDMENNIYEYQNARDFVTDAITLGNTAMLDKIRIEQDNPGTYPELSFLADSISATELEDAYTKARTSNYIFQNEQRLTLRQIESAAQDLSFNSVSKKAELMNQLGSLYTADELGVLFETDPTLKTLITEGSITSSDISAAQTLSGIRQTLVQQDINAPRLAALENTILKNYQNPPPDGQEVQYAQGLQSAIRQYGELLMMPDDQVQVMVDSIVSGYQYAWANTKDYAALEKANLTAQTLLVGAQTQLAYANTGAANRSNRSTGGTKGMDILDTQRLINTITSPIDDKLASIREEKKNVCSYTDSGSIAGGQVQVDAARCAVLTEDENYYIDQKVYAIESAGLGVPGTRSQAGQEQDALATWVDGRVPYLLPGLLAKGLSQEEAEAEATRAAYQEGQRLGKGGIYSWAGSGYIGNYNENTYEVPYQTPSPTFDNQPDAPGSSPVPQSNNQPQGEWGIHNIGANLNQSYESLKSAPGQIAGQVRQGLSPLFENMGNFFGGGNKE